MPTGPGRIDEERARAIWLRAAELQADAAQRLEERTRRLAVPGSDPPDDGLDPDAVRGAAIEAGIAPEFIDLALAESEGSLEPGQGLQGWKDRYATTLLGTEVRRLDFSRTIAAPPDRVLEVMQQVLPSSPYLLTLRDTVGDDPLDGAVMVFQVPGVVGLNYTSFAYKMSWADLRELRFVLRPRDEGTQTEVQVSIPLERSRRLNWIVGQVLTGVGGLGGGVVGLAVAKATALAGAMVAAPVAAGALALGGLGAWGIKTAYRAGLRKGAEEINALLKTLDVTCRLGAGFFRSPGPKGGAGRRDILPPTT